MLTYLKSVYTKLHSHLGEMEVFLCGCISICLNLQNKIERLTDTDMDWIQTYHSCNNDSPRTWGKNVNTSLFSLGWSMTVIKT